MIVEELKDLKEVWSELAKVWDQVEQLKEQPWLSVQPRKLRQALDALAELLKKFPARLRQYMSYEHINNTIKQYIKVGHFNIIGREMLFACLILFCYMIMQCHLLLVLCFFSTIELSVLK